MKSPLRKLIHRTKEYFFYKDKRPLFDVTDQNRNLIYNDKTFSGRKRETYYKYGKCLEKLLSPQSMLDLGCANGYLVEYFLKKGKHVVGAEFADAAYPYMEPETLKHVLKLDLSKPIPSDPRLTTSFDVVNCTDVGEHIPLKYETVFLDNLRKLTSRYLILSWANTWEEWLGMNLQKHVNPRSKKYVINLLNQRGLKFEPQLTKQFAQDLKQNELRENWYKNIMIFEVNGKR